MVQTLEVVAGVNAEWRIPVVDADGVAVDVTGMTAARFLIKSSINDADGSAIVDVAYPTKVLIGDGPAGFVDIKLVGADTALLTGERYVWGLRATIDSKDWAFPDPTEPTGKVLVRTPVVQAIS